jgi:sugar (pentulose or hexulose) kinase
MTNSRETVLAIDVGTQGTGAFAFDARGRLIDGVRTPYEPPYFSPQPGWAEQEPDFYWGKVGEVCHRLWTQGRVLPADLAGLVLTCQRGTVVNLDRTGRPLRPAILWLDQRRTGTFPKLPPVWRILFKILGLNPTLHYLQGEAEFNWIAQHQPEIRQATAHYLYLSGYLNYRLTGEFADSVGCQVGYMPFHYRRQQWAGSRDWRWPALGIDREVLPTLVRPGSLLGQVSREAAGHTGLSPGLPVISGASDKACEVLGTGCLGPAQGCIGYGTTATINVNSLRYFEPVTLIPSYPSAMPGAYNLEVQIFRGCWMITWFKEQFAQLEQETARREGIPAEAFLERGASRVPAGCSGLMLQPYWSPGVRFPGLEAKGSIIGFGSSHKKEHLYRAILEGLAYGLREGRERIERKTRFPMRELFVCGGGSRSDLLMQITADVFGLPAYRPSLYETSALGAAVLAAAGLGLHPDLSTAVREMTVRGAGFEPDREAARIYDDLYQAVYRRLYPRLRPLYKAVRRLTGYPDLPG